MEYKLIHPDNLILSPDKKACIEILYRRITVMPSACSHNKDGSSFHACVDAQATS